MNNEFTSEEQAFIKKCKGVRHKEEYVIFLLKGNNKDLLKETLYMQTPDDYDGCYTSYREWAAKITVKILEFRLKQIGWLK